MAVHGKDASMTIGSLAVGGVSYRYNVTYPMVDATVFGDEWQFNYAGLPSVEGSFEGFVTDGFPGAILAPVTVALFANGGGYATGPAYVFAGVSAAVNDAVRISGTFKSTGEWTFG
jgi:hypothetical protein